jgi:hypothetical protein
LRFSGFEGLWASGFEGLRVSQFQGFIVWRVRALSVSGFENLRV